MSANAQDKVRVAITGIGLLTPLGSDMNQIWDCLLKGESGVRRITLFDASDLPCQIAGEVPDYQPEAYMPLKEARRMSRASQLGLASALLALSDAGLGLPLLDPPRVGVYFGTGFGGFERAVEGIEELKLKGVHRLGPFYLPSALPNMAAFHIAHRIGAAGPNSTITTACATGTQSIGEATQAIRNGWADMILAGGTEALIQYFAVAGFAAMHALPIHFNDQPEKASRPFDFKREGFVFSEGAACLVLERLEHASARGAHVYGEVLGYASTSDGFHLAASDPHAAGPIRTMHLALQDAGIGPQEVDYINAHGTSTPSNDKAETKAIKEVFQERAYAIPISSTKSMIGHTMGAAGAIEAAVCALTIDRGFIHPTTNYEEPDPECDLDYVPNCARQADVDIALSNSFGLGAQNACLILRRIQPSARQ